MSIGICYAFTMYNLKKCLRLSQSTKMKFLLRERHYPQVYHHPAVNVINSQIIIKRGFQVEHPKKCNIVTTNDKLEEEAQKDVPKQTVASEFEIMEIIDDILECRLKDTHSLTLDAKVRNLCANYSKYNPESVMMFLRTLATNYGVDHVNAVELSRAVINAHQTENVGAILKAENELRSCLQSRSFWLFQQIGKSTQGVKFLVDLRKDVLEALDFLDRTDPNVPHLRAVNAKLIDLLRMWFSVSRLDLQQITWNSPCELLQKICEYESVHPVQNFDEIKNRIGPNRRCFMFRHSAMPNEPIHVLTVLLSNTILTKISDIEESNKSAVTTEDPNVIDTANFYSIVSPQKGLKGIDTGTYILKSVVKTLQSEFPRMRRFITLSPIPGFYNWLLQQLLVMENNEGTGLIQLFTLEELSNMAPLVNPDIAKISENPNKVMCTELRRTLTSMVWYKNKEMHRVFQAPLMRLCAKYLYHEKRDKGYALDSVANFHLRNGAIMWKLNWNADPSPDGLARSCGIMVNYRYFMDTSEYYGTHYIDTKLIEANDAVTDLAREAMAIKNGVIEKESSETEVDNKV